MGTGLLTAQKSTLPISPNPCLQFQVPEDEEADLDSRREMTRREVALVNQQTSRSALMHIVMRRDRRYLGSTFPIRRASVGKVPECHTRVDRSPSLSAFQMDIGWRSQLAASGQMRWPPTRARVHYELICCWRRIYEMMVDGNGIGAKDDRRAGVALRPARQPPPNVNVFADRWARRRRNVPFTHCARRAGMSGSQARLFIPSVVRQVRRRV